MSTVFSFDLSRVWGYFKDKNFGIISAYLPNQDNKQAQIALKKDVRELGLGYKEIKGAWRPNKESPITFEYALFVPNMTPAQAITLGKKYNQYSVIYADKEHDIIIHDKLGHEANDVFTRLEAGLKDGWISWSEFRRHKFRFSEVEWDMTLPPSDVDSAGKANALQSFLNDNGITEYSKDLQRALLIDKVKKKLKG
jgi:hypothetical protein